MAQVTKLGPGGYPVAEVPPGGLLVGVAATGAEGGVSVFVPNPAQITKLGTGGYPVAEGFFGPIVSCSLASVSASSRTNNFGVNEQIGVTGVHGTGAVGSLTGSAGFSAVLIPAYGTGLTSQPGVSISVSATTGHGKSKGHGKGQGPQSILRAELGDVAGTGRVTSPGFVVKVLNSVTVGLIGVNGVGAANDLDFTIDESVALSSAVGTAAKNSLTAGLARSLTDVHAAGADNSLSSRLEPTPTLSAVHGSGGVGTLSVTLDETTELDVGLHASTASGHVGALSVSDDRGLLTGVSLGAGTATPIGSEISISLAAAAAAGIAGGVFSQIEVMPSASVCAGVGGSLPVAVGLRSVSAFGSVGLFQIYEILPQEGLTCDLHASVNFGDLGATANLGDLAAQAKTNDLGAGLRCD